jgi:Ribosomal proteins 50S-L18Ae/60S-L20/60S-L18A
MSRLHEYQVIGRKLPTENDAAPNLYRMRIFAPNTQVAKSRFWYFLKQARKVKKASGEIVAVNEVPPPLRLPILGHKLTWGGDFGEEARDGQELWHLVAI